MSATIERPQAEPTRPPAPAPDRFVAAVAFALAAVLVGYQVITTPFMVPLAVFAVLFTAVGAALWWRQPRWLLTLAGLLAVGLVVGAAPVFAAHLPHPESPAGFVPDVLLLTGVAVLLYGVAGSLRPSGPRSRRPVVYAAVAVAVAATVLSVVTAVTADSATQQPGDVAVDVHRWQFPDVDVPAGATALWVDNRDAFHHTLVVEDTDVRADLPGSAAVRVPVDLEPGTYRYLCDVPGHDDMVGTLHVR